MKTTRHPFRPLSGGSYLVTSISGTGTYDSVSYSIVGLFGLPFGSDQTLYTPGNNGSNPPDNLQLSLAGLGFIVGFSPTVFDAVSISDGTAFGAPPYVAYDYFGAFATIGNFTATIVPVPEPSQVVSMLSLAGFGGAGLLLNLRRRK